MISARVIHLRKKAFSEPEMHMHLSLNKILFSNYIATDNNLFRLKVGSKFSFQHEQDK